METCSKAILPTAADTGLREVKIRVEDELKTPICKKKVEVKEKGRGSWR